MGNKWISLDTLDSTKEYTISDPSGILVYTSDKGIKYCDVIYVNYGFAVAYNMGMGTDIRHDNPTHYMLMCDIEPPVK